MATLEALPLPLRKTPTPIIEPRPGAKIARRYQIKRLLASGGMATIYEAYDIMLERPVALKVLRPQVGKMPELLERFLNEARHGQASRSSCGSRARLWGGSSTFRSWSYHTSSSNCWTGSILDCSAAKCSVQSRRSPRVICLMPARDLPRHMPWVSYTVISSRKTFFWHDKAMGPK